MWLFMVKNCLWWKIDLVKDTREMRISEKPFFASGVSLGENGCGS